MISRYTGLPISENEHIEQSILDILTTNIGTRVMRRDYGTILLESIDKPLNELLKMQLVSTILIGITLYEPRIEVQSIKVGNVDSEQGRESAFPLEIDAVKRENRQAFSTRLII